MSGRRVPAPADPEGARLLPQPALQHRGDPPRRRAPALPLRTARAGPRQALRKGRAWAGDYNPRDEGRARRTAVAHRGAPRGAKDRVRPAHLPGGAAAARAGHPAGPARQPLRAHARSRSSARSTRPATACWCCSRPGSAPAWCAAEGDRYLLTTTGAMILKDDLTRINMDFVHHNCFQAMFHLEESIRRGEPAGLQKVFGDFETIYPALSTLPRARARELVPLGPLLLRRSLRAGPAARLRALAAQAARRRRQHRQVGDPLRAALAGGLGHDPRPPRAGRRRRAQHRAAGLQSRITTQAIDLLDHCAALPGGLRRDLDEPVPGVLLRSGRAQAAAARRGRHGAGQRALHPRHLLGPAGARGRGLLRCRRSRSTSPASRTATAACTSTPTSPRWSTPPACASRRLPARSASARRCSSAAGADAAAIEWWAGLDSNQRPRDYESPALTD